MSIFSAVFRWRRYVARRRRPGFLLISGMSLCLVAAVNLLPVQAQVEEYRQQRQQVEQQKQQIQKARERVKAQAKDAEKNLTGIRKTIKATTATIAANEAKLKQAGEKLSQLEANLGKAESVYQKQQTSTVARLQVMQRQRGSSGWAVLLQSQSMNDFLDRRQRLKQVFEADRKVLVQLKTETDKIVKQRNAVEQQKQRITILTQQKLAQRAEQQQKESYQRQTIEKLKTDKLALEAAMSILSQDSVNLTALIRQRAKVERRQQIGPGNVVVIGSGQVSFPVTAPLSSEFGYRMHPILGYAKFHAGLDFAADYGEVIRSAAPGYVIFAGWYGGYGNTVIVDHGNGVTTLYAHADGLYVEEGQQVQRGEPIALVGSTGLSTGPHLHFELRSNGEPVDPLPYM
ncbi:peptidoglycan DD-metalloendopeptidase family protein [filamentous cyanobacterium LEGE 11480]|uniref:Peptidoglycan DD-metalloendopeptidase family protein n=1 Tax=Romeriopsis navalis LEGE 11480 TaxID=2777977 RepID=A0A928Z2H7_9CYAN|nr:peptidoglycan DD-metalloendopeptidase family protein [Romeriopsis navalis LEGE 11480]